jgi:4'-phosphopantetheinyl transferase
VRRGVTLAPAPYEVLVALRSTQDMDEAAARAEAGCLDAEEHAQAARLRFAEDRRDHLAAHALLRRTLSALAPCDPATWVFAHGPGGKPHLATGGPLVFNLSHTRGWVACAVARGGAVGVDVERVRDAPDLAALALAYFSPLECDALQACAPADRAAHFAGLWTLKESCAKGLGTGIGMGLPDVSFQFPARAGPMTAHGAAAVGWQYALCELPGAQLAVAARAPLGSSVRFVLGACPPGCCWRGCTSGAVAAAREWALGFTDAQHPDT